MSKRRTLGAWLAWWIGLSTAGSIAAYGVATAALLWLDEVHEDDKFEPGGFDDQDAAEIVAQTGLALAVAAPIGILLASMGARWLTRRATRRIDDVVATATRMSADDLGQRLPVSPRDDELDDLARALNALFARIADGIAAQRQFAADASHELRSPLAVLASTLEVARRRPRSPADWEDFADRALAEVQHMTTLVDALLMLARAGTVRRIRIDLAELVDAAVDRAATAAAQAQVTLVADAPGPLLADADPDMLGVAIGNLVVNALAHSPIGAAVHIRLTTDGAAALLHVDDTGPGVPLADRGSIFSPFVRADAPAADRMQGRVGLGLGLAIARRVAQGHDGRITVGEAPGGGARFTISLPRA